jgi:nucleoside-diphosphate-sugar epimerase
MSSSSPRIVVLGAGPVGATLARQLVADGEPGVRLVSRSGSGPEHHAIDRHRADAADLAALRAATAGAEVIVNALNPPYHRWAQEWPALHEHTMTVARETGAVLVLVDNLYAYGDTGGRPLSPDLPTSATFTNGRVRAEMAAALLAEHAAGRLRATIARASDFVGPLVTGSSFGDRVVPRVLAGKSVSVLGALDQPHSFAYMPDVARTLATIARDPRALGHVWHVPSGPAITQRAAVTRLAELAGTKVAVKVVPPAMLAIAGLVAPAIRPLRDVRYQFTQPFVVDATATEQSFGLRATPLDQALRATLDWYRDGTLPALEPSSGFTQRSQ